ncbi:hypothetical protein EJ03DRAFT_105914 [Teratosphaeria nubilosa]|uniref:F-box domain-containing protein n=1 Tax=Teratosphaeria nubilosa TaxID=161662 RepID=A0A6G1LLD3_9PEZI|nr:hypothetical protein EJ03DRAFT_105914 [Teratosphaeria nubilosa]
MTSKATEVFGITELAEQILLALPMRALLLAQRVNRTFYDTIASSPHIQEALFFRPAKKPTSDINPLLTCVFNVTEAQVRLHTSHIVTQESAGNGPWTVEQKLLLGIALF